MPVFRGTHAGRARVFGITVIGGSKYWTRDLVALIVRWTDGLQELPGLEVEPPDLSNRENPEGT